MRLKKNNSIAKTTCKKLQQLQELHLQSFFVRKPYQLKLLKVAALI